LGYSCQGTIREFGEPLAVLVEPIYIEAILTHKWTKKGILDYCVTNKYPYTRRLLQLANQRLGGINTSTDDLQMYIPLLFCGKKEARRMELRHASRSMGNMMTGKEFDEMLKLGITQSIIKKVGQETYVLT